MSDDTHPFDSLERIRSLSKAINQYSSISAIALSNADAIHSSMEGITESLKTVFSTIDTSEISNMVNNFKLSYTSSASEVAKVLQDLPSLDFLSTVIDTYSDGVESDDCVEFPATLVPDSIYSVDTKSTDTKSVSFIDGLTLLITILFALLSMAQAEYHHRQNIATELQHSIESDELKTKELELKEAELELRREELEHSKMQYKVLDSTIQQLSDLYCYSPKEDCSLHSEAPEVSDYVQPAQSVDVDSLDNKTE